MKGIDINSVCDSYKESFDYIFNNLSSKTSNHIGVSYNELKKMEIPSEALQTFVEKMSQNDFNSKVKNSIIKLIILDHQNDDNLNLLIKEKYYSFFKKEIDSIFEDFDYNRCNEDSLKNVFKYFDFYTKNCSENLINEKIIDNFFSEKSLFNGDLKINKNKIDILTTFMKENPEYTALIIPNMFKYIHYYKENYNSGCDIKDNENKNSLELHFVNKLGEINKLIDTSIFAKITEKINKYAPKIFQDFSKVFSSIEKKTILKTISSDISTNTENETIVKKKRLQSSQNKNVDLIVELLYYPFVVKILIKIKEENTML